MTYKKRPEIVAETEAKKVVTESMINVAEGMLEIVERSIAKAKKEPPYQERYLAEMRADRATIEANIAAWKRQVESFDEVINANKGEPDAAE